MKKIEYSNGDRVGECVYLYDTKKVGNQRHALFKCRCGKDFQAEIKSIKRKQTKSCGCLQKEIFLKMVTKHGFYNNRMYSVWNNMIQRCYNLKDKKYNCYGGRGIKVCEEWQESPDFFIKWSEENGYLEGLELDRIDNDGDYSPENCRFITHKDNLRNTRRNRMLTYNGETMCSSQWAEMIGISKVAFHMRVHRGWDIDKIMTYSR